jgi:hypothetical protein
VAEKSLKETVMKKYLLFNVIIILIISCNKPQNENATDSSFVTVHLQADARLCACCGGYLLSRQDSSTIYLADSIPSNFTVPPSGIVRIKFHTIDNHCYSANALISVDEIKE